MFYKRGIYFMTQSKYLSLLIHSLFLLLLLSACSSKDDKVLNSNKLASGVGNIEAIIVQPSTIAQDIQVSGTLLPFDETVLMAEVSGRAVNVNLPEGKTVAKGTVLVKLFDGDLQAQVHKLQVQLQIAQATQKRQSELLKINGISQLDYDNSVLAVDNLQADINLLQVNISKTEIRAPYDGKIGLKKISVGAFLNTNTPIATIRAEQQLKLDFGVPEKYSSSIQTGKTINFAIQGADTKYEATVIATEQSIESNTRNLKVRAIVNGSHSNLVAGAFANVRLRMGQNSTALMVPTQCVIPQARDKKVIVAHSGKATFVKVKTGVRESSTIEITEGIQAGDTVITTGLLFLRPDGDLKISRIN